MLKIAVIGAGAWGTTLAHVFGNNDSVRAFIWSRRAEVVNKINGSRENTKYSGCKSKIRGVEATNDIRECLSGAKLVINALPCYAFGEVFKGAGFFIEKDSIVINASKGIDLQTRDLPHKFFQKVLPDGIDYYSLSGPSFASGVLDSHPTIITIAGTNKTAIKLIKDLGREKNVYINFSKDIIGVEWSAVYKNVIAIAAGFSCGLGYGENTSALVFYTGYKEMVRSGIKLGALAETFNEPSGIGDLMLSTAFVKSRNYSFGMNLGRKQSLKRGLRIQKNIPEGYYTLKFLEYVRGKYGLSLPLADMLQTVIFNKADGKKAFNKFLSRSL